MNIPTAVQPVYMPSWVRVVAIVVSLVIILPPLIHMVAHTYLMLRGLDVVETGSDWPRVVLIVLGAGIGFPDPVVRLVRGWRRVPENTAERRTERLP